MAVTTANHVIPLVSSGVAGPLGVDHLPRLWLKLTLGANNSLPEGYDECGPGFDAMTLSALHLDRDKTMEFVRKEKPTYMQFEQWVLDQNGGSIDTERIERHNRAVRGYHHSEGLAEEIRTSCGCKNADVMDAVTLNMIEDLDAFHKQLSGK